MATSVNPSLLASKIESLTSTEHAEIFRMLQCKSNSSSYTHNQNGVFYNLNDLDEETLSQVSQFVDYCVHNARLLQEYDKNLHMHAHRPNNKNSTNETSPMTSVTVSATPLTSGNIKTKDITAVLGDSAKFLQMRKKLNKTRWLPFHTKDDIAC